MELEILGTEALGSSRMAVRSKRPLQYCLMTGKNLLNCWYLLEREYNMAPTHPMKLVLVEEYSSREQLAP